MSDPIERQDVIDEAEKWIEAYNSGRGGQRERDAIKHVISGIKKLPSAQPKERTEERTETHACDLISRQAAIDAHYEYCNKHPDAGFPVWSLKILEDLPPAQPDMSGYSDKLWKKAYERGKAEALDEIVRCKDCLYWVAHDKRCVYLNHGFAPNMWCCHGRRADG